MPEIRHRCTARTTRSTSLIPPESIVPPLTCDVLMVLKIMDVTARSMVALKTLPRREEVLPLPGMATSRIRRPVLLITATGWMIIIMPPPRLPDSSSSITGSSPFRLPTSTTPTIVPTPHTMPTLRTGGTSLHHPACESATITVAATDITITHPSTPIRTVPRRPVPNRMMLILVIPGLLHSTTTTTPTSTPTTLPVEMGAVLDIR
mmetsp:Transcript_13631/g.29005  ORF Transcript_13631/g.29005 Transcript_13631/m.29005 type:complete len:206 (+) Transcript_13631:294-911(+)